MRRNFRKRLIALCTFLSGLYFFLEFLLPASIDGFEFGAYHDQISRGFITIGAMAIGLGIINILRIHGGNILRKRKGLVNSVALVAGLLIMLAFEGGDFINAEKRTYSWRRFSHIQQYLGTFKATPEGFTAEKQEAVAVALETYLLEYQQGDDYLSLATVDAPASELQTNFSQALATSISIARGGRLESVESRTALEDSLKRTVEAAQKLADERYQASTLKKGITILREGFFFPLGAAMFSLLAFYIATAAYRSFRIKSLEAFVMMSAAVLVLLGQIPQGPLYIYDGLPGLRLWMLENMSTPAFRAIFFGSAIAGLAMAIRMWLSLEQSPLALDDSET